jgi:phosphohistidine phosphatase
VKTLHLLRHAKSSWDEPGLADRERPLNKRGRRDAPRMGRALAALIPVPDIHVSPARRARLTLAGLCDGWPALAARPASVEDALYTFSAAQVLDWLQRQPDQRSSLFVIGHNPALTDLINLLAGQPVCANLPTAAYARLGLRIGRWRDIGPGCGDLECLLRPRQLAEG